MHGHDLAVSAAENYRAFAEDARGRSPAYECLAGSVAEDAAVLRFLGTLPPEKRQPNLLFAAARYLLGAPADITGLRALIRQNSAELAGVMMARRTQTNEPARCATLLPALAQLPPPLALIEVGASAGLTLLFDRYSYDYAGHQIAGQDPLAPVLRCTPRGPVPLPDRLPAITWRAGLDLSPLDVASDDDVRWLSCLAALASRHAQLRRRAPAGPVPGPVPAPFDLVAAQSTAISEDDGLVTAVAMASLVAAGRGGRNALRTARAARLALCRPRFLSQSGE